MVTGSLARTCAPTAPRPINDSPRLPRRRISPNQRPYCTHTGTSSPSMRSSASRSTDAVATVYPSRA